MADDPVTEEWKGLLCGRHRLESINGSLRHPRLSGDDPDETVAIQMDGRVFLFLEDGNDGWRSSLGMILTGRGYLNGSRIDRDVDVTYVTSGEHYASISSVFEFRDAKTGKLALCVGTSDIDDYYPSFIWRYDPTAFEET